MTDDYISRQDAVSRFSDLLMVELKGKRLPTWDEVYNAMQDVPSADVQPVRHGHWTLQEDRTKKLYGWHICSECGAFIGEPTNYCSNCGAIMDGEQNG